MKRSRQHSAKAFTLIEVMVAGTIMLAGIVAGAQVLVSGAEMLDTSRKQAVALQIINSELAAVRMMNLSGTWSATTPTALSNIASTKTYLPNKYPPGSLATPSSYSDAYFQKAITTFNFSRDVSLVGSRTDFKKVTVTVTWTKYLGGWDSVAHDYYKRTYTRSGTTYVGKNGLYVTYQR